MTRFQDWPARLLAEIDAARDRPFVWGEHDCLMFVGDCVNAMTGIDPAAWFRGRYSSQRTWEMTLKQYPGTFGHVANQVFLSVGMEPCPVSMAGRGDVAMTLTPIGDTLGIVWGQNVFMTGLDGLEGYPARAARLAWKV